MSVNTVSENINRHILSSYPAEYQPAEVSLLDTVPSLSICRHWRVSSPDITFLLRRIPFNCITKEHLQFQQAVLWQAVCEGITFVPLPLETKRHKGFVSYGGGYWELLPWFPPQEELDSQCSSADGLLSVNNSPNSNILFRIVSAMMSLAQFHIAVSTFPVPNCSVSISEKCGEQLSLWKYYLGGHLHKLHNILSNALSNPQYCSRLPNYAALADCGFRAIEQALLYTGQAMSMLKKGAEVPVPIQVIIGNVCGRHLRFDEDGLCGIIDFKELCIDSVSWDIASLLGSTAGCNSMLWSAGIKAYQSIRPLTRNEMFLIKTFELSPFLLKALDYLAKVFLEDQLFTDRQIAELTRRIENWCRRFEIERKHRCIA
ncbi:hypothetical protein FACS18942_08190 [Planctomycetales bacterium]|nr:hypothetical protein FACS18942_08190 [Planctomycetales bacterium]